MKPLLIDLVHSDWYYTIFYGLAFLVSFIILVVAGRNRNIPQLPWLIVIAAGFISFVIGCRLITLSTEDWSLILSNQPLGHPTGLVMMGGLLFCVPFILLVKKLVNLNESVLDAYTFVLPVGMCLQRIGCFLNGCCFGSVTSGFGIQYGADTSAFYNHLNESIISEGTLASMPVHPVQLYESLGCIIAVVFILNVRHNFKSAGSLFYLSGLCYYVVRFFTEFFRDPDAHAVETPVWYDLNTVQWLMVFLIGASIIIITVKERLARPEPVNGNQNFRLIYIVYFFALCIVFSIASKWLSSAERFVVYIVLFTTVVYLSAELFKLITVPGFRIASLSLILLSPIIMCQTYPEQTGSDTTRISYNTISVGGLMGVQEMAMTTGCDEPSEYHNKYRLMGMGLSRTVQTGQEKSYTFGLSTFIGTIDESVDGTYAGDRPELNMYGFTPYFQSDYRNFGFGTGLHLGDMPYFTEEPTATSFKRYSVFPQAYLRFGRLSRFFGELSWARSFPGSSPGNVFQANLGFPLKRSLYNSGVFRIGTSSSTGIFVAASIPAGKHLIIEPYLGFLGSPLMMAHGYDENKGTLGSLSLHYKFSRHDIPNKHVNP